MDHASSFTHIFPVDIQHELSNSRKVKYRISFYTIILRVLLLTLLLPVATQADEVNPWKKVQTCVFGMPYIGHAVGPHETGLITSILKAVYKPESINLVHKELPYKRALEELASGTIQCTLDLKDHRKGFYQGKTTMAFYDLSATYKNKTEWKGVDSLRGAKVAYLHGFDLENFISVNFEPQLVYDLSSAFHMLDRGHVDFILGDKLLLQDAMYESKVPSHDLVVSKIKSYEVRPLFSKNAAGLKFRDIYDRRMKGMMATGEFAEIVFEQGLTPKSLQRILDAN